MLRVLIPYTLFWTRRWYASGTGRRTGACGSSRCHPCSATRWPGPWH